MNELERRTLLSAAGIGALSAFAKAGRAGPLDPPVGPVAPSGRTLDEVYNRIPASLPNGSGDGRIPIYGGAGSISITAPGSYFLTGNIDAAATGISILSSDVTLDLNGYRIACGDAISFGVNIGGANRSGITLRNGTITGGQAGVFGTSAHSGVVLEDLRISRARQYGIHFLDTGSRGFVVRRCHVLDTGATTTAADSTLVVAGISLGGDAHRVHECTVSRLYNLSSGGTMRGIIINGNGANSGVLVERCYITHDLTINGIGLMMSPGGVYRDNTVGPMFSTAYSAANNIDGGGNV